MYAAMSRQDNFERELKQAIENELTTYSKTVAEQSCLPNNPLSNPTQLAKKIEFELKEKLETTRKQCSDAVMNCLEILKSESNFEIVQEDLKQGFSKLSSLENVQKRGQEANDGTPWSTLLGLKEETLQALYKASKQLYDSQMNTEAESAFTLLVTLDSARPTFWLCLGHSQFRLNKFEQALASYQTAKVLQPSSIWTEVYLANCYEALHDFDHARAALETAQSLLKDSEEMDLDLKEVLHERITLIKNREMP
jgi:tetratricopeptide (TPR) repeat protein